MFLFIQILVLYQGLYFWHFIIISPRFVLKSE